jgi:hypothetical protein
MDDHHFGYKKKFLKKTIGTSMAYYNISCRCTAQKGVKNTSLKEIGSLINILTCITWT